MGVRACARVCVGFCVFAFCVYMFGCLCMRARMCMSLGYLCMYVCICALCVLCVCALCVYFVCVCLCVCFVCVHMYICVYFIEGEKESVYVHVFVKKTKRRSILFLLRPCSMDFVVM